MDTNSQQFQDALQNLTAAFFQFLKVVNPSGVSREADILYIAQSLQTIAAHMGNIPHTDSATKLVTEAREFSQPVPQVEQPVLQEKQPAKVTTLPEQPNLFREQPFFDKRSGLWVFDRPRPIDGDSKLFKLYTNENDGAFEMKAVSVENWQSVYESRDKILPAAVVEVEGDMTSSAQSISIGRGILKKEGNLWRVVQPCKVRVISV